MSGRSKSRSSATMLALSALAPLALLVYAVRERGGALRLASLLLHRLGSAPPGRRPPFEDSRLYTRRRRRLGAHLVRRSGGRWTVLALPLDGSRHAVAYAVGESTPWEDFERQAGLVGAAWGPLRSANAGL